MEDTQAIIDALLENQRLLTLASEPDQEVAQFQRISIPLVRRIYPQLIANQVVSVQPLLGPTSLAFYERFRYSSNSGRGQPVKYRKPYVPPKINWLQEGF